MRHVPAFASRSALASLSRSTAARWRDLAWLAGVAVVTFALTRPGLATSRPATHAEAVLAAHLTGTAPPPGHAGAPLAWLLPDLWARATSGYDRWPTAVAAGREAALVSHVVAAMLLWALCRRVALSRPIAGLAVLAWVASPLVIETSHLLTGAALASPWVLAGFVLAGAERARLATALLSWFALLVAIALSPASLLFGAGVAAVMWRQLDMVDRGDTEHLARLRRQLEVPAAIAGSCLLAYVVVAGALGYWPVTGWRSRTADGLSMFVTPSGTGHALHHLLVTDPVLPILGLALSLVALRHRSRPFAAQVVLAAVAFAIGLSPLDVFNVLPIAALVIVSGVAVQLARAGARSAPAGALAAPTPAGHYDRREVAAQGLVALVGLGVVVATCAWPEPLAGVWRGGHGPRAAAGATAPVVPRAASAAKPSSPPTVTAGATVRATALRSTAGVELAANDSLTLSSRAHDDLVAGQVDTRLMTDLALLVGISPLTVAAFAAEPAAGPALRTATISLVDGGPATADSQSAQRLRRVLLAQHAPFRPSDVTLDGSGLSLTFSGPEPSDLLVDDPSPQNPQENP